MKINIINTTTDSSKTAKLIAESLVQKDLAPCVQIIKNIKSTYRWKRKIIHSDEFLLIIKTIPKHVLACKNYILELHNYDSPEIIVTEARILLDKYRDWFLDNSIS